MVIFEAARAICNLKDVTTRELTPAVTLLQLFLSSNKPVVRFAAVRTLNKVSPAPRPCVCELQPGSTPVRGQGLNHHAIPVHAPGSTSL